MIGQKQKTHTDTCSQSLRDYYDTVSNDCKVKKNTKSIVSIWGGWNETCVKDTKTGRYCNDIIDEFPKIDEDEELPLKYLCHPCYGKRLSMMHFSPYALNVKWWEEQVELVNKRCGKSLETESPPPPKKEEPSESQSSQAVSKVPHETSSANEPDETTASAENTVSPTITASLKVTTSPEGNAAAMLRQGKLYGCWYLMFIILINVFYL